MTNNLSLNQPNVKNFFNLLRLGLADFLTAEKTTSETSIKKEKGAFPRLGPFSESPFTIPCYRLNAADEKSCETPYDGDASREPRRK
jgi:hypothetical protein